VVAQSDFELFQGQRNRQPAYTPPSMPLHGEAAGVGAPYTDSVRSFKMPSPQHGDGLAGTVPIGGSGSSPDTLLSPKLSNHPHPSAAHTDLSNSNDLFCDAQGEPDPSQAQPLPTDDAQVQEAGETELGGSNTEIRV
jgi:hypothetical protein